MNTGVRSIVGVVNRICGSNRNVDFPLQPPGVDAPNGHTQGRRAACPFIIVTDHSDCWTVGVLSHSPSEPPDPLREEGIRWVRSQDTWVGNWFCRYLDFTLAPCSWVSLYVKMERLILSISKVLWSRLRKTADYKPAEVGPWCLRCIVCRVAVHWARLCPQRAPNWRRVPLSLGMMPQGQSLLDSIPHCLLPPSLRMHLAVFFTRDPYSFPRVEVCSSSFSWWESNHF